MERKPLVVNEENTEEVADLLGMLRTLDVSHVKDNGIEFAKDLVSTNLVYYSDRLHRHDPPKHCIEMINFLSNDYERLLRIEKLTE